MSIYDKASLVLIPSGTKTSKVYVPTNGDGDFTFSRSTAATRVNASGNIEKETQNLLTYSNDFAGNWLRYNATNTSGQSGYDGSNDATLVTATGTFCRTYKDVSGSGVYTGSIYVKAGTAPWVLFRIQGTNNNQLYVNLSDGTYVVSGGDVISQKVESIGSGWYRLQLSVSTTLVTFNVYPALGNADLGTSNETIYIQDAQLEQGLVARDYIETTTTAIYGGITDNVPRLDSTTTAIYGGITDNVPRLDYTNSSCPALLLEPQRTNSANHSEYHSSGGYSNNYVSVIDNEAISPEGIQNAAKIVLDSGTNSINGGHYLTYTSTPSQKYTISVFAKAAGYRYFTFTYGSTNAAGGHFDLQEGVKLGDITNAQYTNTSASIEDYGNGWYRLIVSVTDTSSAGRFLSMRPSPTASVPSNNNYSSTGDGTSGAYIYGFQLEIGASYATSYIPTYGSAVTRNGERPYVNGINNVIGGTEGTIFFDITTNKTLTSTNYKQFFYYTDSSSAQAYMYVSNNNYIVGNPNLGNIISNTQLAADTQYKIAITYKANDFKLYINGSQDKTSTSGSVIDAENIISIGSYIGNSEFNEFRFNSYMHFQQVLSNEELATLTTI
jgi:hypothetical protein